MKMLVLRDVIATPTDRSTIPYPAGWRGTAPRGVIEQLVAGGAAQVIEDDPPAESEAPPAPAAPEAVEAPVDAAPADEAADETAEPAPGEPA